LTGKAAERPRSEPQASGVDTTAGEYQASGAATAGLLRPAQPADAARLAAVGAACFGSPWGEPSLCSALAEAGTAGWVWQPAPIAPPAGYVLARRVGDEVELLHLAVTAPWRGRGAGGALLQRLVAWSRAEAVRAIHLEVADANATARRLYARHGFVAVGCRPRYYGDEDAILMRLELP
jgi:[ribosomal protein S18]-alanine N-acetyltransferase